MKFKQLEQLFEDYKTVRAAYDSAVIEAKAVTAMEEKRIENEREQARTWIVELEDQVNDMSRAETVKRLAQLEFEKLKNETCAATAEETAMFAAEIEKAEQAVVDVGKIRCEIREVISGVNEEIALIRSKTLGDQWPTLVHNWLNGEKKRFERLGGTST